METDSLLRLLIVEDSPADAGLIQANLRVGLGKVEVKRVDRLSDAMAAVSDVDYSAVLLDLNLPDSSGVETFRQLAASTNGTPIVVLSGMHDNETAIEAVGAGADDYVQKDHYDAHTLARSIRFAIERNTRRAAERELINFRSEMTVAQAIQDSLYPGSAPQIDGLEIASGIRSAGLGCGDYYDFIELNDGRQAIVVGDVSGHGMGSAIVMAETRACLRTLTDIDVQLQVILPAMNRLILAGTADGMFVTLLLIVFDPRTGVYEYFNAGHPGWIIRADKYERLNTHQVPLGLIMDVDHSSSDTFRLNPGDILIAPTDGIMEAPCDGEIFGTNRMLDCVANNRNRSANEIVDCLFDEALDYSGSEDLADDMTVVIAKAK